MKKILVTRKLIKTSEDYAAKIFDVILNVVKDFKVAAFIVTHNDSLARQMDRVVSLKDGVLVDG